MRNVKKILAVMLLVVPLLVGKPLAVQASQSGSKGKLDKSIEVVRNVDYSELRKMIAIADNLSKENYTPESWESFGVVWTDAKECLESDSQSEVDYQTEALRKAINSLVKMDYSKLREAIQDATEVMDNDSTAELWGELKTALSVGRKLLESDEQNKVNDSAKEIQALLEEIKATEAEQPAEKVYVEVEPTNDYCNISSHKIWPIAFFASLVLNFLLLFVFILPNKKNKRNEA